MTYYLIPIIGALCALHANASGLGPFTNTFTHGPISGPGYAMATLQVPPVHGAIIQVRCQLSGIAGVDESINPMLESPWGTYATMSKTGAVAQVEMVAATFNGEAPSGGWRLHVWAAGAESWKLEILTHETRLDAIERRVITWPTGFSETNLYLKAVGAPNQAYLLEGSTNLVQWTPVDRLGSGFFMPPSGSTIFSTPATVPRRFYRLQALPRIFR